MEKKFTLGIIGAGNMASAILGGILRGGLLRADRIAVSDRDEGKLAVMAQNGVSVTSDNREIAASAEYLLFAVKPQVAPSVFEEVAPVIEAGTVISIMAGIPVSKLRAALGERNYVRVMPNTPALVGEGMSAIAFEEGKRSQFVADIFSSIGKVVELDESKFDAVTSLSGSGPAYVYMFLKALIDGGVDGGLSPEDAKTLAVQTVRGAAKMVRLSTAPIDELIDAVCSKGGTTIQAVESFRANGLEEIVKKGMAKCKKRSEELANA